MKICGANDQKSLMIIFTWLRFTNRHNNIEIIWLVIMYKRIDNNVASKEIEMDTFDSQQDCQKLPT